MNVSSDIARLDLRPRRRSLIGYMLGMSVYALVVVGLYPSFKNETSLNQLTENGSLATMLCVLAGRRFELPVTTSGLVGVTAGSLLGR